MKPYIISLALALTFATPSLSHAQGIVPPSVPPAITVPAGNELFLLGRGVGTQNYECQPSGPLGRVAWTLFTPEATLFNDFREQLTTHFFSPNPMEGEIVRATWQDSSDTSIVWARAIGSIADPTGSGAIAWVLLQRAGSQLGPGGGDTLAKATFIQRLNTVGGSTPPTDCDVLPDVGHRAFVPYTADYLFYKAVSR
jgi:hypothetical protein